MQLKTQQKQHRPFQDLFHIHLWSPDLLQCTASQSEDTCWIWATSLKPISRPKQTVSHFIPINTCLSFFFFISSSVFIKEKMTETFRSSLFYPQPQTVSESTSHTRVLGQAQRKKVKTVFKVTISAWFLRDCLDINKDYSNNNPRRSLWTGLNRRSEFKDRDRGNLDLWLFGVTLLPSSLTSSFMFILISVIFKGLLCPQQHVWSHGVWARE